jgi:glycine betaine/proline transport system permease protein
MSENPILNPFDVYQWPAQDWIQSATDWLALNLRPWAQILKWPVAKLLDYLTHFLLSVPQSVFLLCIFLIAWQLAGRRIAVFTLLAMTFLGFVGAWEASVMTLALVITATTFCMLVGVPLGIIAARHDRFSEFIRPVLDVMQTLPAFVYMVPIVMLVGIGNVPGVIVTVIFALPPIIRLTDLGIRNVPASVVEAAAAFGSTRSQILLKIQLPLAVRTILAGINQTLMMVLSMVVYASMIAVEGLGQLVLRGIGRLDMGLATIGGIGIVLLAMILDRITQSVGASTGRSRVASDKRPLDFALTWARAAAGALNIQPKKEEATK